MARVSRATWFALGAAAGVYGVVRAKRIVWAVTPDGLGARAAAVQAGLRTFRHQVADDMAAREAELKERLALRTSSPRGDRLIEPAAKSRPEREDVVTHGHR